MDLFKLTSKPKLACEITPEGVLAARVSDSGQILESCASADLPAGAVTPDLLELNLQDRSAVQQRIRETVGSVAGRTRDVIAVLPDAAVRVVLLDFEALPAKREEAEGVVRFRLKKSLPFDLENAKVSYQAQPTDAGMRVIAAVALNSVVADYEAAFQEAGYSAGVVIPSMLAAVGAADGTNPTLVVKVDVRTTSIAILNRQQLLLFRTLENSLGPRITGEQLAEEVYPSVVFFQDTYNLNIDHIFVSGLPESGGAAPALAAQTGATVQELVGSDKLGNSFGPTPRWKMGGVAGALLS